MVVNWGFAGQVGGIGVGIVFAVLVILALSTWLSSLIIRRLGGDEEETNSNKKGA
jgi:Na+-transporting methylmalonyl-CoA/oxaloacetate decarboxylase gamma subunit